jgi:mannose-1-phosphate guanylyltransferase
MESIDKNLVAIIMAGGVGTRFWPLSTHERPKQFIQLFDDRSLLQKSYDRVAGIVPDERVIVLTNRQFTPLVREQLPNIPDQNIIGEPERKDTAAAVCLGTLVAMKRFGDPVVVILTADHLIEPVEKFQQTLVSAVKEPVDRRTLHLRIKPTHPATGYGYLEVGEKTAIDQDVEHFHVVSFKEKPNAEVAGQYLGPGGILWNSGMFVWTVNAIFGELAPTFQSMWNLTKAVEKMDTDQWEDELQEKFAVLTDFH